jgi:hypothetical protein
MEKLSVAIVSVAGVGFMICAFILYSVFSYAFVADIYWDWFIRSNFANVPNLTFLQFIGLMSMKSIFFHNTPTSDRIKDEYKKDNKVSWLLQVILMPWLGLLTGWLVKSWFF